MKLKRAPNSFQNTNSEAATNTKAAKAVSDSSSVSGSASQRLRRVSGTSQATSANGSIR